MQLFAELRSNHGATTIIGYDFKSSFEDLAQRDEVDCFIVAAECGFSPLGAGSEFFSKDLSVSSSTIASLANWSRFEVDKICIVGVPSKDSSGLLKGIVLASCENSKCYQEYLGRGMLSDEFYYHVTYESIAYATTVLKAKKIGITHLSCGTCFRREIARSNVEAVAHFCDNEPDCPIASFVFAGCCIETRHLQSIRSLNDGRRSEVRKRLNISNFQKNGFDVVTIDYDSR